MPHERGSEQYFDLMVYGLGAFSFGSDTGLSLMLENKRTETLTKIAQTLQTQPEQIAHHMSPLIDNVVTTLEQNGHLQRELHQDLINNLYNISAQISDSVQKAASRIIEAHRYEAEKTRQTMENLAQAIMGTIAQVATQIQETIRESSTSSVSQALATAIDRDKEATFNMPALQIIEMLHTDWGGNFFIQNNLCNQPKALLLIILSVGGNEHYKETQSAAIASLENHLHKQSVHKEILRVAPLALPQLPEQQQKEFVEVIKKIAFDRKGTDDDDEHNAWAIINACAPEIRGKIPEDQQNKLKVFREDLEGYMPESDDFPTGE